MARAYGGVDPEMRFHHWLILWIGAAMAGASFWAITNGVWDVCP